MIFAAKSISVARANLLMNDFVAGLPSPLGFIGLADALARELDLTPWSAGVLPVLHQVSISEGRTKAEMGVSPRKPLGNFSPIEIKEDLVGAVTLSLFLDIPECESEYNVVEGLMRCSIVGGAIQNRNDVTVEEVTADGTAFRQIARGYVMCPPSGDDSTMLSNGDRNGLDRILKVLFPDERHLGYGWKIPIAAGYRLLENPESVPNRKCRRDPSLPHVFAEPLLGLAELVSVRNRSLTELSKQDFKSLFWKWNIENNLVLGHQAWLSINSQKKDMTHE